LTGAGFVVALALAFPPIIFFGIGPALLLSVGALTIAAALKIENSKLKKSISKKLDQQEVNTKAQAMAEVVKSAEVVKKTGLSKGLMDSITKCQDKLNESMKNLDIENQKRENKKREREYKKYISFR